MTSIAPASDTELNTGSLSSNISNQPQDTNPASQSSKNATETDESTSLPSASRDEYPEQRHAGAVGYGPSYNKDAGIGEKITGIKEEVLGKIKKDPSLVEQGKLRKTGELQKREAAAHVCIHPFTITNIDDSTTSGNRPVCES
ncbi:hypothetical protein PILCRDRAFT_822660 [Piloderma croceum F 1598]|uniref:Uncharacterized protein n=1 Tax=Piloderma croceum (strain F 1598) TaxID=765440 RepID=A0A0C3FKX5_PILCF|nr:hypothetical protein PILCRDRAFT_822660 [Piloderma croceum F 1598]